MSTSSTRRLLSTAALLLLPALGVLSDCLAPTEVTLVISTDLDCKATHPVTGISSAGRDVVWDGQENATETDACEGGEIGTLVLVPGDKKTFGVRVVAGVGFTARECATGKSDPGTGHPDPRKPDPSHPDWGCIQATRRLGFVPHAPLKLPIRLYAKCKGKVCPSTTTCAEDGSCVTDDVDCSVTGTCPEPSSSAASTGSGGAGGRGGGGAAGGNGGMGGMGGIGGLGGASSGGADAGCGDTSTDKHNCGYCGHDCLGGDCAGSQCQPLLIQTFSPAEQIGGVAVDQTLVYWTISGGGADGVYGALKANANSGAQLWALPNASDIAATGGGNVYVSRNAPVCDVQRCKPGMGTCVQAMTTDCFAVLGGDPLSDSWVVAQPTVTKVTSNLNGMPFSFQVQTPTDVAMLGDAVATAGFGGIDFRHHGDASGTAWGMKQGPASAVALMTGATLGILGGVVFFSADNQSSTSLSQNEIGSGPLAIAPVPGGGWAVWTVSTALNAPVSAIRAIQFKLPTGMVAGAPITLAPAGLPSDVAADATAVYWGDNGTHAIYKLALP